MLIGSAKRLRPKAAIAQTHFSTGEDAIAYRSTTAGSTELLQRPCEKSLREAGRELRQTVRSVSVAPKILDLGLYTATAKTVGAGV
jgi:hypothetical protein